MIVPQPKKMKSGLWEIRLRVNGRTEFVTARSATECKRQAAYLKTHLQALKKAKGEADNMTLRECQENYIDAQRAVLSPSTIRCYEVYARRRWPEYQYCRVGSIDWQRMVNDETAVVGPKTLKNAWGLVHASLLYAGLPAPTVKLAKCPVREIPFLQPDEITKFMDAVKGRSYEIPALLALHGLRLSEVRALKWENVDLQRGLIRVQGALVRGPDGKVEKKTNKTAKSSRTIPILIPALYRALDASLPKEGNVCPIGEQTLLDDVKRSCRRAGVTEVGVHGLRHSFASLGYHLGISERQLMEWGGWDDINTMHRIYIRLTNTGRSEAADKVREWFATAE